MSSVYPHLNDPIASKSTESEIRKLRLFEDYVNARWNRATRRAVRFAWLLSLLKVNSFINAEEKQNCPTSEETLQIGFRESERGLKLPAFLVHLLTSFNSL